jgi:hypothetical protein
MLGAVFLTVTTTVFTIQFIVSNLGWAVTGSRIDLPPGTLVDLSVARWAFLLDQHGPPPDAVALNQLTYDFMTSNDVVGLGYPYWEVRYMFDRGIIPISPPVGDRFTLGHSRLGGPHVLG